MVRNPLNICSDFSKITVNHLQNVHSHNRCEGKEVPTMSKNNIPGGDNGYDAEEMTVDLDLEDGTTVTCAVITILSVLSKDYIVLLPLDENGDNTEGEVWFYRYSENPDNPNEEPVLDYIEDDEEYEAVAEAFDEYLDAAEFDELVSDEEADS